MRPARGRPPGRLDSLTRRILIAIVVLALALAAPILFVTASVGTLDDATAGERHSRMVMASAERVEQLIVDLESGERGFVITGSERFLQPWKDARREFPAQVAELAALVRPDPGQARRVRAIARAGETFRRFTTRVVELRRRDARAAWRAVASGRGKRIVDGLRVRFDELTATEGRRAARSTEDGVAAVRRAQRRSIATLAGSFLLILGFAVYVRRAVLRPVDELAAVTNRLAMGDLEARAEPAGARELAHLAHSFNVMAASLEARRAESEQNAAELERARARADLAAADARRLAAIVEGSDDAILSKDTNAVILSWNRGAERLYGYSADEVVGRPISLIVPSHRRGEEKEILAEVLAGRPLSLYETERVAKDGRVIPVSLTVSPVRDGDGRIIGASTIAHDVTARRAAEQEAESARIRAEAARVEAERANLAKSEFLSRMSHELRTPLNAILGFGQLLEMGELDERQRESVTHVLRGGNHLLELINEVLDISRIEAGTMTVSVEPVAIGDVVADALSLLRPLAEERGVRFVYAQTELYDRHVMADNQRLKQVLLNLLSNAIKYNRENGAVTVGIEELEPGLRVAVADEGPGIPADRLERLFVPFDRLGAERGDVEGTGLGLALSQRLVEAMGGELGVESSGAGSTFFVDLAVAAGSADGDARRDAPSADSSADLGLREASILYIEDNLSNVRLIEQILAGHAGIRLLPAMQGALGIDLARRHRPDLILLDLHLPDMSGAEVLAALQRDPATSGTPVIVLSADPGDGQIADLRAAGAIEYITKPIGAKRLEGVLQRYLGNELAIS